MTSENIGLKVEGGKLICENCGCEELMVFSTSENRAIFCPDCDKGWKVTEEGFNKLLDLIERSEDDI